jgi:hypothetical protein
MRGCEVTWKGVDKTTKNVFLNLKTKYSRYICTARYITEYIYKSNVIYRQSLRVGSNCEIAGGLGRWLMIGIGLGLWLQIFFFLFFRSPTEKKHVSVSSWYNIINTVGNVLTYRQRVNFRQRHYFVV